MFAVGVAHWAAQFLIVGKKTGPAFKIKRGPNKIKCEREKSAYFPRGETQFRTKFFCLLFFQEKQVSL